MEARYQARIKECKTEDELCQYLLDSVKILSLIHI